MDRLRRLLLSFGVGLALMTTTAKGVAADDDWPTYHHSADRTGVGAAGSTFSDVQPGWTTGVLDGAVYAEPLYVGGRVLACATRRRSMEGTVALGPNREALEERDESGKALDTEAVVLVSGNLGLRSSRSPWAMVPTR